MSQKDPKFSVKSTMYPKGRARSVDGPWKKTAEEAIDAFTVMLSKKELHGMVFQVFLAEEVDEKAAPAGDGKHYYKERPDLNNLVKTTLSGRGISVGP